MVHLRSGQHTTLAAIAFGVTVGPVTAATIYGSVSENQLPAGNRPIQLLCPGQNPISGSTDARGSYRFTLSANGSCIMRMGTAEAPVILSTNPTQYNFEVRNMNGRLVLVQR
jgi:hypothetical protein